MGVAPGPPLRSTVSLPQVFRQPEGADDDQDEHPDHHQLNGMSRKRSPVTVAMTTPASAVRRVASAPVMRCQGGRPYGVPERILGVAGEKDGPAEEREAEEPVTNLENIETRARNSNL